MPFSTEIKEEVLVKSGRRCSLCLAHKGVKIEVHHIIPESISHDNTIDNAIPLCFDCHSDVGHYNPSHPKGNKYSPKELKSHRNRLWLLIKEGKIFNEKPLDLQYLELLIKVFDRPAFNTPFAQEGRMEGFNKAISDTILAINTGLLRTRDNQVIQDVGFGKSLLVNEKWRTIMVQIEVQLQDLLKMISDGLNLGKLKMCHEYCYCGDKDYIDLIDNIRTGIISEINALLQEANLTPLPLTLEMRKK
jgi:hypothetical protein